MERHRLSGGRLKSAGYDAHTQRLEIEFVDSPSKTFKGVPREVWRRLLAAPNPASFYADRIEEEYAFEVGAAAPASSETRARLDSLFGSGPVDG